MMCTAVLHGGVCRRTSTPHNSGNNMKGKAKKGLRVFNDNGELFVADTCLRMHGEISREPFDSSGYPGTEDIDLQALCLVICFAVHFLSDIVATSSSVFAYKQ